MPSIAALQLPFASLHASGKFKLLKDLVPQLRSEGHRILLFSQWTTILDLLEPLLNSIDVKYLRLDGSTEVAARQALCDQYNSTEDITVFLLSTRAGGMGLNLTSADTVIIFDLDWNPHVDRQAQDRCHRIGQTKPVRVIKLVSAGTVDEGIYKMQTRKQKLDDELRKGGGAAATASSGTASRSASPANTSAMAEILEDVVNRAT